MIPEDHDTRVNEKKKFHFDNIYIDNPRLYEDVLLYQIGDLSCDIGYEIGEHRQICYEISYVVSGKGSFYTNGVPYRVRKGDIFLSLPGEYHNCIADQIDPFRYFYLGYVFNEQRDGQNPITHLQRMFDQVKNPMMHENFNIQEPFQNIFSEIINSGNYTDLMIKTYLHQIIVLVYRNFYARWERKYTPHGDDHKSKKIVYEVIHYIDTQLYKITDLSEIAAGLGYSYPYLSRVFTHETGFNIQDYFQRKRFEKAAKLLKNTNSSITAIAEDLHYQSIHSFSKAFRKYFGISPTIYQGFSQKDK